MTRSKAWLAARELGRTDRRKQVERLLATIEHLQSVIQHLKEHGSSGYPHHPYCISCEWGPCECRTDTQAEPARQPESPGNERTSSPDGKILKRSRL